MIKRTSILASVAGALLAAGIPQSANAVDTKSYSAGGCAPYTTGTPNYNELRFRSDGVQNQANGYRYVICPLVRDSETTWGYPLVGGDTANVIVDFRTNTAGNFQCTLTGGSTFGGSYAITKSISGDPGENLTMAFTFVDFHAQGLGESPVSLVCRLPPKGTLAKYRVNELGVTHRPAP